MRYRGWSSGLPAKREAISCRLSYGCSHNACTFCPTYKGSRFQPRDLQEVIEDIGQASRLMPRTERVFLADGNALVPPDRRSHHHTHRPGRCVPRLDRVGIYANGVDILEKSQEDLESLHELGSGYPLPGPGERDDEVLRRVRKVDSSERMVEAVRKARGAA